MIAAAEKVAPLGLPHVTTILKDAGLIDVEWIPDMARDVGVAVHAACEYLDQGDLDRGSLAPEVAPRLAQYELFLAQLRPEVLSVEEVVSNVRYGYQGRLDRRIRIHGREGVLDIKGPMVAVWHGSQLAAYAHCFEHPLARWTLHLTDTRYKLIEHTRMSDWWTFLSALTKWKETNDGR